MAIRGIRYERKDIIPSYIICNNTIYKRERIMDENTKQEYVRAYTHRSDEDKHVLQARINRIIGQLNGIKKMIDDDRSNDDILVQFSAVDRSMLSTVNAMLKMYIRSQLVEDLKNGKEEAIDEIVELFRRFQ